MPANRTAWKYFPAHAAVRDGLLGEIRKLGLEPQVPCTCGIRLVRPGFVLGGAVENILVRLPGTDPTGTILLMSHYDSTGCSAGGFCLLVAEEKTGLPSFPGLATQPEPATMRSPGKFYPGDATDFTAVK